MTSLKPVLFSITSAACLCLNAPSMTRIVAALAEAELVAREADPEDGRVVWVRVTADGRRLLDRSRRRKEAYLARALRTLGPDDLATLEDAAALLERLTEAPA